MVVRLKPKSYGPIRVHFDGDGGVSFAEGADGDFQPHPPHSTPVATLLASLAHCLVESLRIVARGRGLTAGAFTVTVTGEKALDLPNRLGSIGYAFAGWPMERDDGADLIADAKSICTVSNSLGSVTLARVDPVND